MAKNLIDILTKPCVYIYPIFRHTLGEVCVGEGKRWENLKDHALDFIWNSCVENFISIFI